MPAIKHPEFSEEQEWRIVLIHGAFENDPPTKYRAGLFGIVPYKELSTTTGTRLPIRTITQGPTVDRVLAKQAVEMVVRDAGYSDVKVSVSNIPLR